MGWFDGDPVNIFPLTKNERAVRLEKMMASDYSCGGSGVKKMISEALRVYRQSEQQRSENDVAAAVKQLQWALEVASYAVRASRPKSGDNKQARGIMVGCLRALAKVRLLLGDLLYLRCCNFNGNCNINFF